MLSFCEWGDPRLQGAHPESHSPGSRGPAGRDMSSTPNTKHPGALCSKEPSPPGGSWILTLGDPGPGAGLHAAPWELCGLEPVALPLWACLFICTWASWQCWVLSRWGLVKGGGGALGGLCPVPCCLLPTKGARLELLKGRRGLECQGCKLQRLSCFYGNLEDCSSGGRGGGGAPLPEGRGLGPRVTAEP